MTAGHGAAIFGCSGPELTQAERDFFRDFNPFGFILFGRNIVSPDQVRALCETLRAACGHDAPIFVDQEGGRVERFTRPHWRSWPPARDEVARAGGGAARAMWLRYRIIADELRAVGLDGNCAPLADIATPATHPILANRCYGEDVETVVTIARAVAEGCLAGGVLPVLKHIPGHGRPNADSHLELPCTDADRATLEATDFAAFRALADLPLGMTAHVVYTAIDPDHPATTSRAVIDLIRTGIGFDGLLITDDLSMQALDGTLGARACASLAAGCDLALHCNGEITEMREVAAAAGALSGDAARRAEAALAARKPRESIDISALIAEYDALTAGG